MSTAILTSPELPLAQITVEQYHRMIEAGVLTKKDRVELIEGSLVRKMPKNPPHRVAVALLQDLLTASIPHGWHITKEDPVTLDNSEPEPDLSIVRGENRDDLQRHPASSDLALVVEISDSSVSADRAMATIYARNRIPVYWIVNLNGKTIEVYTDPEGDGEWATYTDVRIVGPGESVPLAVDGQPCSAVSVDDILP